MTEQPIKPQIGQAAMLENSIGYHLGALGYGE